MGVVFVRIWMGLARWLLIKRPWDKPRTESTYIFEIYQTKGLLNAILSKKPSHCLRQRIITRYYHERTIWIQSYFNHIYTTEINGYTIWKRYAYLTKVIRITCNHRARNEYGVSVCLRQFVLMINATLMGLWIIHWDWSKRQMWNERNLVFQNIGIRWMQSEWRFPSFLLVILRRWIDT